MAHASLCGVQAAHDVREYHAGVQRFRHSLVGDLTLNYETLALAADPGGS